MTWSRVGAGLLRGRRYAWAERATAWLHRNGGLTNIRGGQAVREGWARDVGLVALRIQHLPCSYSPGGEADCCCANCKAVIRFLKGRDHCLTDRWAVFADARGVTGLKPPS